MPDLAQERAHLDRANELLGNAWHSIERRESPDFAAIEDTVRVGIEVTRIYRSQNRKKGSLDKSRESKGQRTLMKIADQYYSQRSAPIAVQVVGWNRVQSPASAVLSCLLAHQPSQTITRKEYEPLPGLSIKIRDVSQTRGEYRLWTIVDDRVGWVGEVAEHDLQQTVNKKGSKLFVYGEEFSKIYLLMVADRMWRSGMVLPNAVSRINNPGFDRIFFLSYPEEIWELSQDGS